MRDRSLVQTYADALARQLGRPAEDIRARGLSALDFRDTLNFEFVDHSHATFHGAFFLHGPARWAVVVFTEHCGYFVFPDGVRISTESGQAMFDGLR